MQSSSFSNSIKSFSPARKALIGVGLWLVVAAFAYFGQRGRGGWTPIAVAALCVINAGVHYLRYRKMNSR